MTVPPGTFACAAAVTFEAVSPVRSVSSLRCRPHGCAALGAVLGAVVLGVVVVAAVEDEDHVFDPLAALATP